MERLLIVPHLAFHLHLNQAASAMVTTYHLRTLDPMVAILPHLLAQN
jgi:hypothetical protein